MRTPTNDTESSWTATEFATVAFNDTRLNRRCIRVAEQLAAQPTQSIPQACADWAATKAAYRFAANPKVTPAGILAPHFDCTTTRLHTQQLVLAVQDTTFFNFTAHPHTTGLGEIGNKQQCQRGFGMHSTVALTPQGLPLGLLTHTCFTRPVGEPAHTPAELHKLPIEAKESYRWVEALAQTQARVPAGVEVVSICDREADIYEMFAWAAEHQAALLVRASADRRLATAKVQHLWAKVEGQRKAGELVVLITGNQERAARETTVALRYCAVTLKPPPRPARTPKLPLVTLTAILVREIRPPAEVAEPIEWLLLTTTPITNLDDVERVVGWYGCRWQIEVFHKILKSGCRVEACRLQTATGLYNYLALMTVVAWRVHWVTYLNRRTPDAPCTIALTTTEWQALYLHFQKTTSFPTQPPTVRQAVHWIARLGGFLNRKSDGEPGITVLWRGWQRLQDLAALWETVVQAQPKLVGNR